MTDASIELQGNKAVLSMGGKKFFLQVFSGENVSFQSEPAKAYHKETKDNTGINLLYLNFNSDLNQETVEYSVVMGKNLNGITDVIANSRLDSW